jgi:4-amino-4-deoxy-L-arabinose transferase-like glycosyltransferase
VPSSEPPALSPPATVRLVAALIVLLAAVLRLWGNDAAAPFRMGVDEPAILSTSLRMIRTADFNPQFFDYGGLTLYFHTAVGVLAFMGGAMEGRLGTLGDFWEGDMLAAGRTATALLGALTVYLVFRIGLRWGVAVALISAFAIAVLPAHVREAHFILTDTPLTLFVTLALLLSIRAVEAGRLGAVALAGVGVGLAAAIKYNGAVALVMPLLAALALPAGFRVAGLLVTCLSAAGAFLLCAPYTVLALPDFLNRFAGLMNVYSRERSLADGAMNYVAHLRNWFTWSGVLPTQFGYLAIGLSLAGWAIVATRARTAAGWLRAAVLIFFPAIYFWFVASQFLQYGRYLLPIGPMVCIGLAVGLTGAARGITARWPAARPAALPLLLIPILGVPLVASISWLSTHVKISTGEQAAQWLVDRGPEAARVVVEDAVAVHLPPPVVTIKTRELAVRGIDEYLRDGTTHLVFSSLTTDRYYADPERYRDQIAVHRTLMATTEAVATFTATAEHPGPTVTVLRIRR